MKEVKYSTARQTLRTLLDECVQTNEPFCIVSKANRVVVMSEAEYKELSRPSLMRDVYGNPPGYVSTFMDDAIDAATKRVVADIKLKCGK